MHSHTSTRTHAHTHASTHQQKLTLMQINKHNYLIMCECVYVGLFACALTSVHASVYMRVNARVNVRMYKHMRECVCASNFVKACTCAYSPHCLLVWRLNAHVTATSHSNPRLLVCAIHRLETMHHR